MTRRIGLAVKSGAPEAVALANQVRDWAERNSWSVCLEEKSSRVINWKVEIFPAAELTKACQAIVTLGGDGTLLSIARHSYGDGPCLIGVNMGRLGFLTEVAPEELAVTLEALNAGTALCDERGMLDVKLVRNGEVSFSDQSLNDVVVQKGSRENLVDLDLYLDHRELMRIRGDGVILATPTGSTAYSLSAGGAIVYPSLPAMLVTPICPHSLTSRPLVLSSQSTLTIKLPKGSEDADVFLCVDGQAARPVTVADAIRVTGSKNRARLVRTPAKGYFEILRSKLNWGIPNRGGI